MAGDQTFRPILAFGMAVFLPVALYHRSRSQAGGAVALNSTGDARFGGGFSRSAPR